MRNKMQDEKDFTLNNEEPEEEKEKEEWVKVLHRSIEHEEERQVWYRCYQDYINASEERYNKKIQSLRSACRQQMRNLVVKLHKEYEDKLIKLKAGHDKTLTCQRSAMVRKINQLEKSLEIYQNKLKVATSRGNYSRGLLLSDSEKEVDLDSTLHEKCHQELRELVSLLNDKEENISQMREELQEASLLIEEKQKTIEEINFRHKLAIQKRLRNQKHSSTQTTNIYKQIAREIRILKMASLRSEVLESLTITEDPKQLMTIEKLKGSQANLQAILVAHEGKIKDLKEKIESLESKLEKSQQSNRDFQKRFKIMQKTFYSDEYLKRPSQLKRSRNEDTGLMKKAYEKKIAILQDSMQTIRNEMYLRQSLEKHSMMLHRAGISYVGKTERSENIYKHQPKPSDKNVQNPKGNTTLPDIQDITQELSAILAENGWWKQ